MMINVSRPRHQRQIFKGIIGSILVNMMNDKAFGYGASGLQPNKISIRHPYIWLCDLYPCPGEIPFVFSGRY
jgi:hypothetical protein